MSAFPAALEPGPRSKVRKDAGLRTYRTEGGQVRGRRAYSKTVYTLQLVYELLTAAEVELVVGNPASSHFDLDPAGAHTVTVDGETFDVRYLNEPEVARYHGTFRTLVVNFLGTKQ